MTGLSRVSLCTISTSEEPIYPVNRVVYLASSERNRNSLNLTVNLRQGELKSQSNTLLDSGAFSNFIHHEFVRQQGFQIRTLFNQIRVFNADASPNHKSVINSYVRSITSYYQ